jgi:diguanylate cyclase (GGDEF)-like protein
MFVVAQKVFSAPFNNLSPARIALLYLSVGIVWILFSDTSTAWFVKDKVQFEQIAILKGILFVIVSASSLYLLIRYYAGQLQSSQKTFQQAEQEINKLAYYDSETGLPNHNLLLDRLKQVIAFNSRKRKNTAVIYISLTGFKAVVDARGHSGGCEAVCAISDRLVSMLREYDTVARIHRDEFVLVLGGTVREGDVAMILNKLQALFSVPLRLGTDERMVPACFGVACFPTDGVTSELLLQNAHIAMNQARQNGETLQYYSEKLNLKALERQDIETGLMRAMDSGEFFLCYQPKIAINGKDNVIGMEALVRWQRPGLGIIPPDKFIPVAEENGLIVRLGTWVLKEACRQNKAWQDAGLPKLKVAVNLSAYQLRDSAFVILVTQILAETGLDPNYLELELTESALMGDTGDTVSKLLRLKDLGVSISVDDFGTGYSSLSYLKHLPIDTIKVDRSFVRDIVNDPEDAAIVDAIVAMAHALKLNVIAEGVETAEQLEFLRQRKCQQVQGYFFSKPLVPHHFEYFLRTGLASVATTGPLSFNFTSDFSSFEGFWSYKDQLDWNNAWNGTINSLEQGSGVRSYSTNYGTLKLIFDGEKVSGNYTHNDGLIAGIMHGTQLTGVWTQELKKHYVAPVSANTETNLLLFDSSLPSLDNAESGGQMDDTRPVIEIPAEFIGEITIKPWPVQAGDTIPTVLNRIQNDSNLLVLPVVEKGKLVGAINRSTFIEEHVIGRHGFGFHINHSTKIRDLMVPVELVLESHVSIVEAAKLIQTSRQSITRMDNIFVLTNGEYLGIVDVNKFVNAITAINLTLAKGANPLTGLPGNESIQREINERLQTGDCFDIAYIDIDNFKPFNDYYGFQRGDVVIKAIGEIISEVTRSKGAGFSCFCGHIGGDDFIVITGAYHAEYISSQIITALEEQLVVFHGEKDFSAGQYSAVNRKGEEETFGLLSLSIGIVNTRLTPVTSYGQLASISTEVKKAAKKLPGSSVVINRRTNEDAEQSGLDSSFSEVYAPGLF